MLLLARRGGTAMKRRSGAAPPTDPTPTIYLDGSHPSASNSNAGTSAALPKLNLAGISNLSLSPGAVVGIKRGTSYTGELTLAASGTSGNPITYSAYGTGAAPVLSNPGQNYNIMIWDRSWIVIQDLKITNSFRAGVYTGPTASNVTTRRCDISATGAGLQLTGSNTLTTHCYIHDLTMITDTPDTGGNTNDDDSGAMGLLLVSSNNHEVAFCKFERCKAHSYDYGTDGGVIEMWKACSNILVHDNWCQDNNGFIECGSDVTSDVLTGVQIYNNVLWNNGGVTSLHNMAGGSAFGVTIDSFVVTRNTVVETGSGSVIFNSSGAPGPNFSWTRNLVYAPGYNNIYNPTNTRHTDNFYQVGHTVPGTNEVNGTCSFVDRPGGDFHPTAAHASETYGAYTNGGNPTSANPTTGTGGGGGGTRNVVPAGKNKIRNSDWYLAAVGTWPENTNPALFQLAGGVSVSVTGVGTSTLDSQTVPWIDIRFQGAAASPGNSYLWFDASLIPVANGAQWNMSGYIARSAGTATNTSSIYIFSEMSSTLNGTDWVHGVYRDAAPLATSLTRATQTNAAIAAGYARPGMYLTTTGGAVDITVRLAGYQFEAGSSPTALLRTSSNDVG